MYNVVDKLNDLSWLGEAYADQGWFVVGEYTPVEPSTPAELVLARAKTMLAESDWTVLSDVPMTTGARAAWIEYRRALREVKLQPGFPEDVQWPKAPE